MTSWNQLNLEKAESHIGHRVKMAFLGTSDEQRLPCSGRVLGAIVRIDLRTAVDVLEQQFTEWLVEAVATAPVVVGNAIPFPTFSTLLTLRFRYPLAATFSGFTFGDPTWGRPIVCRSPCLGLYRSLLHPSILTPGTIRQFRSFSRPISGLLQLN